MECRLLIHNSDLQQFSWSKLDSTTGDMLESGVATSENLTEMGASCSRITVYLPMQDILLTTHQFPHKVNKQQLNAIAYTVEDSLAQDIEDCFFSTTPGQGQHQVDVAVIDREKMDLYASFLSSHQINAHSILPQIYLCPWSDDAELLATVCAHDEGYIVRYGINSGFYSAGPALNRNLKLLISQSADEQTRLEIYAKDVNLRFDQEELKVVNLAPIETLAQKRDPRHTLDLKQKEHRSSYQVFSTLKHWKWPIASAVLLVILLVAIQLIDRHQKQLELDSIYNDQHVLLKKYLPDASPGDSSKKQLIKALSSFENGQGGAGFIDFMHEYSRLKSEFPAVKTSRIQFFDSKLVINLESKNLSSLEAFRSKLAQSRFKANIEDVNISPEKTSGRLVMEDS